MVIIGTNSLPFEALGRKHSCHGEQLSKREKKVQMHFIFMNTDISVREINGKRKVRWSDT